MDGSGSVDLRLHPDEASLVARATGRIVDAMAEDRLGGEVLILLSGGATPVPVYRAMASQVKSWAGVTISLVDERWVPADSPGSNARMIRATLFGAGGGRFWPLADLELGWLRSVDGAVARFNSLSAPPSLVVLGMGDDGHTASLFPGSPDLSRALACAQPYAAVDARGCAGAGLWPQRISLTPAGWRPARRRMMLMRGGPKLRLFERAMRERDPMVLPVSAAITEGDAPLEVHWCP